MIPTDSDEAAVLERAKNLRTRLFEAPEMETAEAAVTLANAGALRLTNAVTVRSVAGERFNRIVKYDLGAMPDDPQLETVASTVLDDDVPF